MLALPLPLIGSLIIAFLAMRTLLREGRLSLPVVLLAVLSMQGAIVALVQHYGLTMLRPLQPVTAAMVPPVAWLTFTGTARRPLTLAMDWAHGLGPLFFAFCVIMAPEAVDAGLILLFIGYGAAMLFVARDGADGLPMVRLEAGDWPIHVWRLIALSLLMSALSDFLIALAYLFGKPALKLYFLDAFSSFFLLAIGMLGISQSTAAPLPEEVAEVRGSEPNDAVAEAALVRRLDGLLQDTGLYREPELTLARLARRLNVPAKQLSAAINRQCGESVSRHVNAFRIADACARIAAGAPITGAMLESGFNTKSNFNREFQRIMNTSPSLWRDGLAASPRLPAPETGSGRPALPA